MTVLQLSYRKEEFARFGNKIYESQVHPLVEQDNQLWQNSCERH
jgi:hypothetical protein